MVGLAPEAQSLRTRREVIRIEQVFDATKQLPVVQLVTDRQVNHIVAVDWSLIAAVKPLFVGVETVTGEHV